MAINPSADVKAAIVGAVEAGSKDDLNGYYRPELQGSDNKSELPGAAVHREGSELYGSDVAREVEGSGHLMELAGSPVGPEYYGNSRAVLGASPRDHSPSSRSALSPESLSNGYAERNAASPISPLARSAYPERGSPLRQSESSNGGARSAPRSLVTPQSQTSNPETNRIRGRGLGLNLERGSRSGPGSANMI